MIQEAFEERQADRLTVLRVRIEVVATATNEDEGSLVRFEGGKVVHEGE